MASRVLDTSVLIGHWRVRCSASRSGMTEQLAAQWGRELAKLQGSNAIVTPVYLEFIAFAHSADELRLFESYLAQFAIVDGGNILEDDWREATRLARRVPRNGKPRQLGDCLIRAIANRLNRDVFSLEKYFP